MAKRGKHRVVLNDYKAAKADEGAIEIEAGGEVFVIPAPACWADEIQQLAAAGDNVAMCRAMLGGDEAYGRFVAAGGCSALVASLISEVHGAAVPE